MQRPNLRATTLAEAQRLVRAPRRDAAARVGHARRDLDLERPELGEQRAGLGAQADADRLALPGLERAELAVGELDHAPVLAATDRLCGADRDRARARPQALAGQLDADLARSARRE